MLQVHVAEQGLSSEVGKRIFVLTDGEDNQVHFSQILPHFVVGFVHVC